MIKQITLTRTCAACGLEKPLAAFLYLCSKHGTTYGTICATCRGAGIKEKTAHLQPEDEHSSTSAGMRIGAKERLEIDMRKKLEKQERQDSQEKEVKKREYLFSEKIESRDEKQKAERAHREAYLNYQTKKQVFSSQSMIAQKANERLMNVPVMEEKRRAFEAANMLETIKQEERKTTIDFSSGSPVFDPPHALMSRNNPFFKNLLALWGESAPVAHTISQLYRAIPQLPRDLFTKESPVEFIDRTWGPASRRR